MKDDSGYKVGFGRPPKATRFVKGKSGNPKGRPPSSLCKGAPANIAEILLKELDASITVKEGGRAKKISKQRALLKSLVNRAINGSVQAIAKLLKLVQVHRLHPSNDGDEINVLAERLEFVAGLFENSDKSSMSDAAVEERGRLIEEFLEQPVPYLSGKLPLAPDHPVNRKPPRPKMRPSTTIADDLSCELRERFTFWEGRQKFRITKFEALVKCLLNQAILGNDKAFSLVLAFFKQYGWDEEDGSVLKVRADSELGRFIGLGDRRQAGRRRSDPSERRLARSGEDDGGGDIL
jgi:hypothetical protein